MIGIHDLRFEYGDGDFALHVPELAVPDGETVAITGPSGSGKTTLLNLIAGVIRPASGKVMVGETNLGTLNEKDLRTHRIAHMGLVFQEFELLEYLSVLDNILLPFRINSVLTLTQEVRARAERLAGQVGITGKLARFPDQLSQGERQRAAICRALIVQPTLLLADEPTGNLDPENTHRVLDILLNFAREQGATMITVTHDHALIPRFDRVIDFQSFLNGSDARAPLA
jgi:putative ABC transport system ATP-binding protein